MFKLSFLFKTSTGIHMRANESYLFFFPPLIKYTKSNNDKENKTQKQKTKILRNRATNVCSHKSITNIMLTKRSIWSIDACCPFFCVKIAILHRWSESYLQILNRYEFGDMGILIRSTCHTYA